MKKLYMVLPVAAMLLLGACKKDKKKVEYSISSILSFDVIYNEGSVVKHDSGKASSWNYSFEPNTGEIVYLSAKSTDVIPAGITSIIKYDGITIAKKSAYIYPGGTVSVTDTIQ